MASSQYAKSLDGMLLGGKSLSSTTSVLSSGIFTAILSERNHVSLILNTRNFDLMGLVGQQTEMQHQS